MGSNQSHFAISLETWCGRSRTPFSFPGKRAGLATLRALHLSSFMSINQGNIVYVLRSDSHPDRYYTGLAIETSSSDTTQSKRTLFITPSACFDVPALLSVADRQAIAELCRR